MNAERWDRVKELLHQAMQLAPEQRGRFLDQACSSDNSLRGEVNSLLAADEEVRSTFLRSIPRGSSPGSPTPPGVPTKFGPYEILGPLGKGGMGEVYRARDSRLGRYVAVKILPADMCSDPVRQARFEHEARAASALNHPNIVSVHDIGSQGGIPFIVTELVEGEPLRRVIAKGPVPAEKLVEIAAQLAAGLTAAHAAGVVHRDLKPENIMLTPDMRVKILDFGLAKHTPERMDASDDTQSLTTPGLVMGTIGYLSPEQVRGEPSDARSDIFSLGAVLYELAAGKRAFAGGKPIDVLSAILREQPAALHVDIPPALDRIIFRCLEKDVDRRFQNAGALAAALKNIGEISRMRRVFWAIERNRRAWWSAAAFLVACLAGGGVWMALHPHPTGHPSGQGQAIARADVNEAISRDEIRAVEVPSPTPAPPSPTPEPRKTEAPSPTPEARKIEPPATTPEPRKSTAAPTPEPGKTTAAAAPTPEPGKTTASAAPTPEPGKTTASAAPTPEPRKSTAAPTPEPRKTTASAATTPEPRKTTASAAPTPEPRKTTAADAPRSAVIETIAGRRLKFTADGMPALQVALGHCDGIKCDRAGNIYATDWGNQAIVKIDRNGILHVLLGPDSPPDDRPNDPHGVAIDSSGAVYFNQVFVIRKLLTNGHVIPVAGNGKRGFTPDGVRAVGSAISEVSGLLLAVDGSIVFSEFSNNRVRRIDPQGRLQTIAGNGTRGFAGDGGLAARASLGGPRGLALDRAGNLYIADPHNGCVRRVALDGRISTAAGHGVAGALGCPSGVALSPQGELFIADPCKRRVFVVRGGKLWWVGGKGVDHEEPSGDGLSAAVASFDEWELAFDEQENLLISGPFFGHIYRISHDGKFHVIAGSGLWGVTRDGTPAGEARFEEPLRVAVDGAGNIFITDSMAHRIYRVDHKGIVTQVAGYGQPGFDGEDTPARSYRLNFPHGLRVGPHGNVVFADRENNRVREVTADGRLHTLAGNGKRSYSGDGGRAVAASLNFPYSVALDGAGNIYIADTDNHRVRKVTTDGRISTVAGNGIAGSSGDGGEAERASLDNPTAVEVGANGDLYIADQANHRVRRVAGGIITTLAGDGRPGYAGDGGPAASARLDSPTDLALGADRQLYVLDKFIRRIRKIDLASGIITTFAGNGESTSTGDGGPAIKAGLGRPGGIAVDAAGNVYVTDLESKQLRVIRPESR